MKTRKNSIVVVWLKRDLRLMDHEALSSALATKKPILMLYVAEDSLISSNYFSLRHFNFIKQSLEDLNKRLDLYNTEVLSVSGEIVSIIESIKKEFIIQLKMV